MEYRKPDDLYNLLPGVYRIRDAEQGYPLRALLAIVSEQVKVVQDDITRLWDNFFVETSDDWVIPYIGDLVGSTPLYPVVRGRRADVGKTIYYRRRKGTLPMLEELARDVTGWGAHAVDSFEQLAWSQHLNHLRLGEGHRTVDLRQMDALDRLGGPFETTARLVEVKAPYAGVGDYRPPHGRWNLPVVAFFLWRLTAYPLTKVMPTQAGDPRRYLFSPTGGSQPLFHNPDPEFDEGQLAGETHVPGPIRRLAFLEEMDSYYGEGKSLVIYQEGVPVDAGAILVKDLSTWASPPAGMVAVDVALGRIRFSDDDPAPDPADLRVSYCYGFSAPIGGGSYSRADSLASPDEYDQVFRVQEGTAVATIADALARWDGVQDCLIEIADSRTYEETLAIEPDTGRLVIQAADGERPTIRPAPDGLLRILGDHPDAAITLNGLVIEGGLRVEGDLGGLELQHCTLVPGRSLGIEGEPVEPGFISLEAAPSAVNLKVMLGSCITGPVRLPETVVSLTVSDAIIDGLGGVAVTGPQTTLLRVTVLGETYVRELREATEVIFTAMVKAQRLQAGCVRFSYVPPGGQTPRRYQCQPGLSAASGGLPPRPGFTSVRYGEPGYAQLTLTTPQAIRAGAEDGSEMGAFASLQQPQRLANLRIRLEEYLPFGREPALIFVT